MKRVTDEDRFALGELLKTPRFLTALGNALLEEIEFSEEAVQNMLNTELVIGGQKTLNAFRAAAQADALRNVLPMLLDKAQKPTPGEGIETQES